MFDDNLQIENNDENDDAKEHSQLHDEDYYDYDYEDYGFEYDDYDELDIDEHDDEENLIINDDEEHYDIDEEPFNDVIQENNKDNNYSPFDEIDDDLFVQMDVNKLITQNNNKKSLKIMLKTQGNTW